MSCPVPHAQRASHPLFKPAAASGAGSAASSAASPPPPPPPSPPANAPSACPVHEDARKVWAAGGAAAAAGGAAGAAAAAAPLDPTTSANMMRAPNQQPAPGQLYPLPTRRVRSSIPMGDFTPGHQEGADEAAAGAAGAGASGAGAGAAAAADGDTNWVYPSEQMFFNAMKRKGWGPKEEEMPVVVSIHNAVNERAWMEVMKWERLRSDECDCPKLFKFQGRPKDLSPRARVNALMGYKAPFDRHDWIVDRCGTKVRYIIDFYEGQKGRAQRGRQGFYLDTRPALDSFGAAVDRARMWWKRL